MRENKLSLRACLCGCWSCGSRQEVIHTEPQFTCLLLELLFIFLLMHECMFVCMCESAQVCACRGGVRTALASSSETVPQWLVAHQSD